LVLLVSCCGCGEIGLSTRGVEYRVVEGLDGYGCGKRGLDCFITPPAGGGGRNLCGSEFALNLLLSSKPNALLPPVGGGGGGG